MTQQDWARRADEVEYFDPLTKTQVERARWTMATLAARAEEQGTIAAGTAAHEATLAMLVLGIHPSQEDDTTYSTGPAPLPTTGNSVIPARRN
jgi:hypothetical protein